MIAIAGALALFAALYLYFVAPVFRERIDALRMENKLLLRDIAAIDEMKGDATALKRNIAETEEKLKTIRAKTSVGTETFETQVREKAENAGLADLEFSDEPTFEAEGKPTDSGEVLSSLTFSVTAVGDYAAGLRFMRNLEDSETGFYSVAGFAYSDEYGGAAGDNNEGRSGAERTESGGNTGNNNAGRAGTSDDATGSGRWIFRVAVYYYSLNSDAQPAN
jgi:hypothetical protein